ncbi:MAG: hypothetical protein GF313_12230 [Caldithrix sp.]|nr:hypothetical protein [Caldithrix sp.]
MKKWVIYVVFLVPFLLNGQQSLNVTGRVSMQVTNTDLDENSEIKPDTIASDQYAKGSLVPGLQQRVNLSLFARGEGLDVTLLGDLKNNRWDHIQQWKDVDRLTLNVRFSDIEITLGDFFQTGSELFAQSRQTRGARFAVELDNIYGTGGFLETTFNAGLVREARAIGERLRGFYHQYENSGEYRRYMANAIIRSGWRNRFHLAFKYLMAEDDEQSINDAFNEPLNNRNAGVQSTLFLWGQNLKGFGEFYASQKDTLSANNIQDYAYKGGVDFRYRNFKFLSFYRRIGYDYYTAGYPYLLTDREGIVVEGAYRFADAVVVGLEGEQYEDNLDNREGIPKTTIKIAEISMETYFKNWPRISLSWRYRDDRSDAVDLGEDLLSQTKKQTQTIDGRINFSMGNNRFSISSLYIDLNDRSLVPGGEPLGTLQLVNSMNIYLRPSSQLYLSGGTVYSYMEMTNEQLNHNIYTYASGRWDILRQKLTMEATMSLLYNEADNGGVQDMLSDYNQIAGEFGLEYFFNNNISFKVIVGSDVRRMRYSTEEALQVIADPDYGPQYFDTFESYTGIKYGSEINVLF